MELPMCLVGRRVSYIYVVVCPILYVVVFLVVRSKLGNMFSKKVPKAFWGKSVKLKPILT